MTSLRVIPWVFLIVSLVFAQQPPPSTPTNAEVVSTPAQEPSEPAEFKLVNFDDFSIEEIDDALEPVRDFRIKDSEIKNF